MNTNKKSSQGAATRSEPKNGVSTYHYIPDRSELPPTMVSQNRWLCWRDKKVPIRPDGKPASSTDPATWSSFDDCLSAAGRWQGMGFALGDGIVGIDLDSCNDDPFLAPWAKRILDRFPSYAELSPSRTGVKIFGYSGGFHWTEGSKLMVETDQFGDHAPAVEVYFGSRYFCVTGERATRHRQLADCSDALEWLAAIFRRARERETPQRKTSHSPGPTELGMVERAARYLAATPGAVAGCGGHNHTYRIACKLVSYFGLSNETAIELLKEWNAKCDPPWSERELSHKVESASGRAVQHA